MTQVCDDKVLLNDWHPVARGEDVGVDMPHAARLLGTDIVIWRSRAGIRVWEDRCAHRGVKLSLGKLCEDRLVCPYHGWEYGSDGVCERYPAHENQKPSPRARATTYAVQERYGLIWACLGTPDNDISAFPEVDGGTHRLYFGGTYAVETSGQRAVENFLDVSHFPFVHAGYLGAEPHTEIKDYDVTVTDTGLAVTNVQIWQPKPTNTLDVDGANVDYQYYVQRPLTARLVKDVGMKNRDGSAATEAIVLAVTPVEPERAVAWVVLASNHDEPYADADVRDFTDLIIGQDLRIVESQRPKRLPLDIGRELHLRSDKTAVEYRRWLGSLGVTFGTVGG